MKSLINEVVDRHNQSYKLYMEIEDSSIGGYVDIRFYSTYSGASNPETEQTKWKTTLSYEAINEIEETLSLFMNGV